MARPQTPLVLSGVKRELRKPNLLAFILRKQNLEKQKQIVSHKTEKDKPELRKFLRRAASHEDTASASAICLILFSLCDFSTENFHTSRACVLNIRMDVGLQVACIDRPSLKISIESLKK